MIFAEQIFTKLVFSPKPFVKKLCIQFHKHMPNGLADDTVAERRSDEEIDARAYGQTDRKKLSQRKEKPNGGP
jgi:hypothetical protein